MSDSDEPTIKRIRLMDNINEPSYPSPLDDQRTSDQQPDNLQVEQQLNSLLRLNDDCLRDIFDVLDKDTLVQLADVSTRVRLIAENAFTKRYIVENESVALFRRTLCKFSKLITEMDFKDTDCSQEQINTIVKYCPNLEILRIKIRYDIDLVPNSFPKLIELVSNALFPIQTFCNLISLGPQLQRLEISDIVNDEHITAISQHAKNLEMLKITNFYAYIPITSYTRAPAKLTEERLLQLTELKKLKSFHYNNVPNNFQIFNTTFHNKSAVMEIEFVASLMTAFSKENVYLNSLYLEGISIDSNVVKSISNLKELKYLYLSRIKCDEEEIISLVSELPLLNTLGLKFHILRSVSVIELVKIVEAGKQLHKVDLDNIENIKVNQKRFEKLLEAAANRLNQKTLDIGLSSIGTSMIDVPHDIQEANRHKLQIKSAK